MLIQTKCIIILTGVVLMFLFPMSCTGSGIPAYSDAFIFSDIGRNTSPQATESDISELVTGNTAFACDMYDWLIQGNDNLVFSPYSISMALAMTYAGASGQTKTDMAATLNFRQDDETLHDTFNAVDTLLTNLGENAGRGDQPFTLNIANSLWLEKSLSINPAYLDPLALNYGAGLGHVDLLGDPSGSARIMNDWIDDKTEGLIKDVINPAQLQAVILLIINAIYFKADWNVKFEEQSTYRDRFYNLEGSDSQASMMHNNLSLEYTEGDGYQVVSLPYEGREASMVILLPELEAFENFQNNLDEHFLSDIFDDLEMEEVIITIPKFDFRTNTKLKDVLSDLGMGRAFENYGEFDSMVLEDVGGVFISEVIHEAVIKVDEEGTEAAAVTVVEMMPGSAEPGQEDQPKIFKADHPFIFLIRENSTNTILFMGRVLDPS